MSFCALLAAAEASNASMLCVGLDPEPAKFPLVWRDDPRRIFDSARPSSVPPRTW